MWVRCSRGARRGHHGVRRDGPGRARASREGKRGDRAEAGRCAQPRKKTRGMGLGHGRRVVRGGSEWGGAGLCLWRGDGGRRNVASAGRVFKEWRY